MTAFFWGCLFGAALLFAKEPSAFNAGDLNQPNPYGLTPSERQIVQNRDSIANLKQELFSLRSQIESLQQSYEGFSGVADGELRQLRTKLQAVQESNASAEATVVSVQELIAKNNAIQEKNLQKLQTSVVKLGEIIDGIKQEMVSRKELEEFKKDVVQRVRQTMQGGSAAKESNPKDFSSQDNQEIYQKAVELLSGKRYDEAKARLEWCLEKQYKPAASSFYLGEVAYHQKRFSEAISYYKQSASLYDKASYMPQLMLHAANAFVKTKDTKNARAFYQNLIDLHPESPEADEAKKQLDSLKG